MEQERSILDMDATELAQKIAVREISSLDATNVYINHLEKINPQINCLIEDCFLQAREKAQSADEQLKAGIKPAGKLFGVPISMKESFNVAGMKTTGGLPYRKDLVEEEDAQIVARLKQEGAIILGKTNTPVLCFCQETDNKVYGRSNNPWDVTRTTGGSSGGEAALIAAGGAAVGVGSDIGGSIRFPSHFNGVIGFRSGHKQVPQAGSFPTVDHPLQERMLGIGALAKSVRDARMINEIIAFNLPQSLTLDSFSVIFPIQSLQYPVNPPTLQALTAVNNYLNQHCTVSDEPPPYYNQAAILWQIIMSIDGAREVAQTAFGSRPVRPVKEYLQEVIFKSAQLHRNMSWVLIAANMMKPNLKKLKQIEQTMVEGDQLLTDYLDKRLLILPVYHTPAPKHQTVIRELFSLRMTFKRYLPFVAYANAWGLPSLIIPIAEDSNGLPIGVQIISRVGNEDAIFQMGEIVEKEFRGYKRKKFDLP